MGPQVYRVVVTGAGVVSPLWNSFGFGGNNAMLVLRRYTGA